MKSRWLFALLTALVLVVTTVCVSVFVVLPPLYLSRVVQYADVFSQVAKEEAVSHSLLLAVANAESAFSPDAVSSAGAVGMMQVMPATARWIAERAGLPYTDEMLYDPSYNVRIAARYLGYLSARYEDVWVYAAYNAGEGVVDAWIAQGVEVEAVPYEETRRYVRKVGKLRKRYEARGY